MSEHKKTSIGLLTKESFHQTLLDVMETGANSIEIISRNPIKYYFDSGIFLSLERNIEYGEVCDIVGWLYGDRDDNELNTGKNLDFI